MTTFLFLAGLICLLVGAEVLVRSSSRLAAAAGLSPLLIGLTVVSFGTSAPELAVSLEAARSAQASLTLGNVVGSNIFNVLFILGLSALIGPLTVSRQLVRFDVPLMIGVSAVVIFLARDQSLGRVDGCLLAAALAIYLVWSFWLGQRSEPREPESVEDGGSVPGRHPGGARILSQLLGVVVGLALLVLGSGWLVDSAVAFARLFGVQEVIIGLTIVAVGTSLPEVVTSVVASLRGERDIAVGNVVGSNLFNLLGVLGLSAVVAPSGIPVGASVLTIDLPLMLAVAVACLPIFFTGGRISRWEGGLFFGYYLAYTAYLFLAATNPELLPPFRFTMLYFVIPLTGITLGVTVVQALRGRKV